jgi:hypothetical protein
LIFGVSNTHRKDGPGGAYPYAGFQLLPKGAVSREALARGAEKLDVVLSFNKPVIEKWVKSCFLSKRSISDG